MPFDFAAISAGLIIFIIVVALLLILAFVPVGLWISALAAGVKVGIVDLIGMRLRLFWIP